jgi:hypothetical protein
MQARINRWLVVAGEWAVLMPVWRRFIRPRNGRVASALATALVWLVVLAAVASDGDGGPNSNDTDAAVRASESPAPAHNTSPARSRSPSHSPKPTANATPEVTPSPSAATQVPAATEVPAGGPAETPGAPPAPGQTLTVLSSTPYTDDIGTFHVAGEVRNNGAEFMEFVEIAGTFFDVAGQTVASEYTYTHADFVAPGEAASFDLSVPDGVSLGITRYDLSVQGEPTADRPATGLIIQGESAGVDGGGDYHVVGTVMNQGGAPAEFVQVIGTFYAADGTVVRSDVAYTNLDVIPPGGADTFDLSVRNGGSAGIARYSLKVEGFAA